MLIGLFVLLLCPRKCDAVFLACVAINPLRSPFNPPPGGLIYRLLSLPYTPWLVNLTIMLNICMLPVLSFDTPGLLLQF